MWQGEIVKIEHVTLKVYENIISPLWWSNYEIAINTAPNNYALLPAIKVIGHNTFYISNHFGIGIRKLRKGGWPNHQHFSFENPQEHKKCLESFESYCEKDFIEHEAKRISWQKENYPIEFERSERLRKLIIKY